MNPGLILRTKRLELGLSQQEVARACGIDQTNYSRYESGSVDVMNASFSVVYKLIRLLGMEADNFLSGKYSEPERNDIAPLPLFLSSKKYDVLASGVYIFASGENISQNHMLVHAESRISPDSNLAEKGWLATEKLRQNLIENGIIVDRVFTADYEFNTPSAACSVICGRHLGGKDVWKTKDGKKLGELVKPSRVRPAKS